MNRTITAALMLLAASSLVGCDEPKKNTSSPTQSTRKYKPELSVTDVAGTTYIFSIEITSPENQCHPCSAAVRLDILEAGSNGKQNVIKSWEDLSLVPDLHFPSGSFGAGPNMSIQNFKDGRPQLLHVESYNTAQGYVTTQISEYHLTNEGLSLLSYELKCTDPDGTTRKGEC
jgi:hypothetical protein